MRIRKLGAALLLPLLVSGCASLGAQPVDAAEGNALSVAALFQAENGDALEGAARFSAGEQSCSGPLDETGAVRISGLPRSGELLLTLFSQRQEVRGAMTLSLGQGAVIDATTGGDGVGHITVRGDTDEVALRFVLSEDGALTCTLWLRADLR